MQDKGTFLEKAWLRMHPSPHLCVTWAEVLCDKTLVWAAK